MRLWDNERQFEVNYSKFGLIPSMFMFQFLFLAINVVNGNFEHDIVSKIQMLHSKTELGTFYELLNVSENASLREIKKQFRRLNREKNPFPGKLNDMEYTDLLMTAFSVLTNHRSKYDAVLANSKYIFASHEYNFKNNKLMLVMATISIILMIDFLIFIRNYFMYVAIPTKNRKGAAPRMICWEIIHKLF